MGKKIVLQITGGSFEKGFTGSLQINQPGQSVASSYPITLPANPDLLSSYEAWSNAYYQYPEIRKAGIRNIYIPDEQETHTPTIDYTEAYNELQNKMEEWLGSHEIRDIKEHILEAVNLQESSTSSLIISTDNSGLQHLPWSIWDLFQRRPQLEISFFNNTF